MLFLSDLQMPFNVSTKQLHCFLTKRQEEKKKTHCYHKVEQEKENYLVKFSGGLIT